jgi:inosine/xanthosine triphosphatase
VVNAAHTAVSLAVASMSDAKVGAVRLAAAAIGLLGTVEVIGVETESDVPQPRADDETLRCAEDRLARLKRGRPESDYWVAIEAGLEQVKGRTMVIAWVIADNGREQGISRSASVEVPKALADMVSLGEELGSAIRRAGTAGLSGGRSMVEVVTAGRLTRQQLYVQPTMLAFARLLPAWDDVSTLGQ